MQYHENVNLSTRDREEYKAMKRYKFLQWWRTRDWRNPRQLPDFRFAQINPLHWSFSRFWSSFIRTEKIEWGGIVYPAYPVLLQSPTTHIPCILQRFWHTLSHACIYSSQKQNIVIPEMMSQSNSSHSPLFLGREHGNVQKYKLWKFVEN